MSQSHSRSDNNDETSTLSSLSKIYRRKISNDIDTTDDEDFYCNDEEKMHQLTEMTTTMSNQHSHSKEKNKRLKVDNNQQRSKYESPRNRKKHHQEYRLEKVEEVDENHNDDNESEEEEYVNDNPAAGIIINKPLSVEDETKFEEE